MGVHHRIHVEDETNCSTSSGSSKTSWKKIRAADEEISDEGIVAAQDILRDEQKHIKDFFEATKVAKAEHDHLEQHFKTVKNQIVDSRGEKAAKSLEELIAKLDDHLSRDIETE